MVGNRIKLKALSLEEILIVLALTGVMTMIIMDAWKMMNDIRRRVLRGADAGVEIFDSLARDSGFIQEKLYRERMDSLMTIQNDNEKADERRVEKRLFFTDEHPLGCRARPDRDFRDTPL